MSQPAHTNRLAWETSPYLLQHAHNPVHWYPWGPEALGRARDEDKPILLSIGYSACHWCHVMERESFENEEIAQVMNENFINIKVDREERPDIDAIYMNAVQLMTGRGGWPLTVFLTPDQAPFFGGTYFPPEDRYGVPGFRRILAAVSQAYGRNRERINDDARESTRRIEALAHVPEQEGKLDLRVLEAAVSRLTADYDPVNGGFGGAPKFPPSMTLAFLMRVCRRTGSGWLRDIVENTLQKMAAGGIYDQIGGGFHRYSVDAEWVVPHFEKMVYDNALLSRCYLEAFLLTGKEDYRRITEETLDYVLRDMRSPEGGFFSSQDADSEGSEGNYYTWSYDEVQGLVGSEVAALFALCFGVNREGNFESRNILHIPRPVEIVARIHRIPLDELNQAISSGKRTLMAARQHRVPPGRDEKILTSWNALMMQSLAEAGIALERDDYREAARDNAELLLRALFREGRLLRSFKDGQAKLQAYLEDHAFLVEGLLSLYEATFELRWLREAEKVARLMLDHFHDPRGGGFFLTADDHETLIQRPKDMYDNATPSGTSAAVRGILRLWHLTGDETWLRPAASTLESMAALLEQHPRAFPNLLCALDFHLSGCSEIALVGLPKDSATKAMLRAVFGTFLPNKVVACGMQGEPRLLQGKSQVRGQTTAYVCRDSSCLPPVTSAAALTKLVTGCPVPVFEGPSENGPEMGTG